MNENPEGTPNPLNPNPAGAPPVQAATPQSVPIQDVKPAQIQDIQPTPAQEPATVPESQPSTLQNQSAVEPPKAEKKSKKGLIIALVILILAAIGGGVAAAILILNPFGSKDAVPAAIEKLIKNGASENIKLNGTIGLSGSLSPALKISFESGINGSSSENYVDAAISFEGLGDDIELKVSELHTKDNNLYLKFSNFSDVLPSLSSLFVSNMLNTRNSSDSSYNYDDSDFDFSYDDSDYDYDFSYDFNCDESGDDSESMLNCLEAYTDSYDLDDEIDYSYLDEISDYQTTSDIMSTLITNAFSNLDDQWIMIPNSDFSSIKDIVKTTGDSQCIIDVAGNLGNYSDDFSSLYKNNPFINYSTDGLKIEKKKDTLYKLSFDAEKLTNFLNSMSTSGFINDLAACSGSTATANISVEETQAVISQIPDIYVEIDDNNNFTRVYLEISDPYGYQTITADISIEYPSSLNISEPSEYTDFNSLLENFGLDTVIDYDTIDITTQD